VGLPIPSRNCWAAGCYDAVERHINNIHRWIGYMANLAESLE
jgi:hypothetical protein